MVVNAMSKKKTSAILAASAALMVLAGSFAFFTDRAELNATGTAGTVDIALDSTGVNFLDANGQDILNPGDLRDAVFKVTNEGNKSVDVRAQVKVTSDVAMTEGAEEFTLVKSDGVTPIDVVKKELSDDNKTITYTIAEESLNGNADLGEARETTDGVTTDEHTYDYKLLFNSAANNDFQEATVSMDVLVEAKQHENTDNDTWSTIATESISTGAFSGINAVPEK